METKTRSKINKIVHEEIFALIKEILPNDATLYKNTNRVGVAASKIIEKMNKEIEREPNSVISEIRHYFRKFRRFEKIREYNERVGDYDHLYIEGFDMAYDNLMGITKKIFREDDIDHYYQSEICLVNTCENPIDEDSTLVRRGYVCVECMQTKQDFLNKKEIQEIQEEVEIND